MVPSENEECEPPKCGPPAERPLECTECKKAIAVRYTEVAGDHITHTIMCADCPQLQHRLHGMASGAAHDSAEGETGLCCGECGTTLNTVRMGSLLGCNHCYEVFDEVLLHELRAAKKVSRHVATAKKSSPIHIGRSPGEIKELSPSLQLLALNEALSETLSREDYEQAAWLRDQIKAIEEQKNGKE